MRRTILLGLFLSALSGCGVVTPKGDPSGMNALIDNLTNIIAPGLKDNNTYREIDLVSDLPGRAQFTDPNLINPWGIAINPTNGVFWISDNGAGVSTLYFDNGTAAPSANAPLIVTIPPPKGGQGPAAPTGVVFNDSTRFVIPVAAATDNTSTDNATTDNITTDNTTSDNATADNVTHDNITRARSIFLFATEDGTISGWNPTVNPTNAILAVDASATGAVFKGLAISNTDDGPFLYATNFHNGTVDMYDQNFKLVKQFTDPGVPLGFAPFNARFLEGHLFVTFAKQKAPENKDDEAGPGNGFISIFDASGNFLLRFASEGTLNSPWGLALAPERFGRFSGMLLVGNFGDGRINVFEPFTGLFLDQLRDESGNPIQIDGLWSLFFGKENFDQTMDNPLFFTAGLNDEADGLFGKIVPVGSHQTE